MLRAPVPVRSGVLNKIRWIRCKSSSTIRSTFIQHFKEKHHHRIVKSSPVVPLCDPTVPFVNAGMNQFKGIFLGQVEPPHMRVVNSQKCIRVGGKHNDLGVVGTDGTHHTFFEMLGNWSFGDYYKEEACSMAWELLTGPFGLKPENLMVTYFGGDAIIDLAEDREVRDIWTALGVPHDRLKLFSSNDNFWEMGATGPCGQCTEIHYINPNGSLTELWNIVFIQFNRDTEGKLHRLPKCFIDTGMGLERIAAILQGVPSSYETDLFQPLIKAIEENSPVAPYRGTYGKEAYLDMAYRRLADHARMISVCLADGVFPAVSVNLKQIMRKSYKLAADVFKNPNLLNILYSEVAKSLGAAYPELVAKEKEAQLLIRHEEAAYGKLRERMVQSWRDLVVVHPEAAALWDVELAGLAQGYRAFKKAMSKQSAIEIHSLGLSRSMIPGSVVFKLYDTHGFPEDLIQRIADLNNLTVDQAGFEKLLAQHKSRHKIALQEQCSNRGHLFNQAIEKLLKFGEKPTDDKAKYEYESKHKNVEFKPLTTEIVAILSQDIEWIDFLDPCEDRPYYLVTRQTNFFCEEGGQPSDTGSIQINPRATFKVESVFKIRDFVFHKGYFTIFGNKLDCVERDLKVTMEVDCVKRWNIMNNHTATHLLNAAIRKVLPGCVVGQIGSKVSDKGLSLNLSVYGALLTQDVVMKAQDLIRESIAADVPVSTRVTNSLAVSRESGVLTVPGETYPETGLRLVEIAPPLYSKELCCGTHVASTGQLREFCVTLVKGAGGNAPAVHAITGDRATEARELFCRARKLSEVIHLVEPQRRKTEVSTMRRQLAEICGTNGAPHAEYADCVSVLDGLMKAPVASDSDLGTEQLQLVAITEVQEAMTKCLLEGRSFVVHFLRCSYLMQAGAVSRALAVCGGAAPVLLLGCAGGVIVAGCRIPTDFITPAFDAKHWLSCILPVFSAKLMAGHTEEYAEMTATKVSLINCEQLVQDAMRIAITFAKVHVDNPTQYKLKTKT